MMLIPKHIHIEARTAASGKGLREADMATSRGSAYRSGNHQTPKWYRRKASHPHPWVKGVTPSKPPQPQMRREPQAADGDQHPESFCDACPRSRPRSVRARTVRPAARPSPLPTHCHQTWKTSSSPTSEDSKTNLYRRNEFRLQRCCVWKTPWSELTGHGVRSQ